MSKRLLTLLVGAMALAVIAVGCGGSDEEETIPKTAYVKQANAICKELNEKSAAKYEVFYKTHKQANDGELKATLLTLYIPNIEARLEALQELPLPATDAKKVEAMFVAWEDGIKKATEAQPVPFQTTSESFEKANKLALNYGLMFCISA